MEAKGKKAFNFDAFISYSTDPDYRLVRTTESFLERIDRLKTPEPLNLKKLEICVDGSDFKLPRVPNADLSEHLPDPIKATIAEHLAKSQYLIVFCSPQARKSTWVADEIQLFLSERSSDDILLVVTDGVDPVNHPEEVFHESLIAIGLHKKPYYDFREYYSKRGFAKRWKSSQGTQHQKVRDYEAERVRLAADLQPDEAVTAGVLQPLWFQEQTRRARKSLAIACGIIVILIGLTWYALEQRSSALENLRISRANLFTTEARRLLPEDPSQALKFSLRSLGEYPTAAASEVLVSSLRRMPAYNQLEIKPGLREQRVTLRDEHRMRGLFFLRNERYIFVLDEAQGTIWDIETGTPVPSILPNAGIAEAVISADGAVLALLLADKTVLVVETAPFSVPKSREELVSGNYATIWLSNDGKLLTGVDPSGRLALVNLGSEHKNIPFMGKPLTLTLNRDNTHLFILTQEGRLGMYDLQQHSWHELARDTGFSSFSCNQEDDLKSILAFIGPRKEGSTLPQRAFDANGLPVELLDLTGYLTAILMEGVSDAGGGNEEKPRTVSYKEACPCRLTYLDAVEALVSSCHFRSTFYEEVWDVRKGRMARSFRGLFSEVSVIQDKAQFIIAGPMAFRSYQLERQEQGQLLVRELDTWRTTLGAKRIGVPRRIVHSPRGTYVASAFAPFLLLQGAPAATISLWANDKADARDGNEHFGLQLKPHPKFTENIVFSPSSARLATYAGDGMLRVWRIIHEDKFLDTRTYVDALDLSGIYEDRDNIILQPLYYPEMFFNFLTAEFDSVNTYIHAAAKLSHINIDEEQIAKLTPHTSWTPAVSAEATVSPGYDFIKGTYDPIIWNEELTTLIRAIHEGTYADGAVLKRYKQIIRHNVLLLSGLQCEWAEGVLQVAHHPDRLTAIYVLGLSGDADKISALTEYAKASQDPSEQQAFLWAIRFLQQYGRVLSLSGVLQTSTPERLTPYHFLAFPMRSPEVTPKDITQLTQLLSHASNKLKKTALEKSGIMPQHSLAPMSFYYIVAGKTINQFLSIIAELLMHMEQYDQALAFASAAREKNPNDPDTYNTLGNIYSAKGEPREAISWYQQSIDKGRTDGWPQLNIAKRYRDLGEPEVAERYYREALHHKDKARVPFEYAEYLNEFAWFIAKHRQNDMDKLKEALAASEQSIRILQKSGDPKDDIPNFLDTLAAIYFALGDKEQARVIQTLARDHFTEGSNSWREYNETLKKYQ